MKLAVEKSVLSGPVPVPASKSHTIRAVVIASLADGTSTISNPLVSADTLSAVEVCCGLGAEIDIGEEWVVRGVGGRPQVPANVLDVGNSGTTLYFTMGMAALADGWSVFTGDMQIRSRPAGPLIDALQGLGVQAFSTRGDGRPPLVLKGPVRGGKIELDGSKTSQYISSLLINCPTAQGDTEIVLNNATEKPYIMMTLDWLADQNIRYEAHDVDWFHIPGGQGYDEFVKAIPADFSSATFFLCAAAITGSELVLEGLDMHDSQGDKAVVDMLRTMGADIEEVPGGLRIRGGGLVGAEFDLSGTPDALPAMAVTGCFASGTTRLVNVPQARLKETDRISVMCRELTKMGARIEELPDGLSITGSPLHAAQVDGHADHRVVMALAIAGLACDGTTEVDTAEAVSITFPDFGELMQRAGANLRLLPDS